MNQKIQNAKLRLALRSGELPYRFQDPDEKTYRKIVCAVGRELGKKFRVNKNGEQWEVSDTL